ncbi:unnamed protein product [Lactuca virosa]|uniref:Uncharacterized protein n=1 Tax=Lactuca virosa TaxID=75947 RepID=A0AAU9PRT0_9ASTR|nr:unnamed protein product [Lactuca virosa]
MADSSGIYRRLWLALIGKDAPASFDPATATLTHPLCDSTNPTTNLRWHAADGGGVSLQTIVVMQPSGRKWRWKKVVRTRQSQQQQQRRGDDSCPLRKLRLQRHRRNGGCG